MVHAQPGIFAQGTRSHYLCEFDARDGVTADALLGAVQRLREPSVTAGGANIVVAFGPDLWRGLRPGAAPDALRSFPTLEGAPSTPHDVFLWVHGTGPDVLLDMARAAVGVLAPVAELVTDLPGFVYRDSRDITGFIDGTENPPVEEAFAVALVEDGPGIGGSFVLAQRWRHDLAAFHALSEDDQELVIGRTKRESIELDDDVKPLDAHIARVVIEDDGGELEIYRRSVPYGTVREHGLFFLAFSADPTRFDRMLARMFGTADGIHDRLTRFTQPQSGAYYFAPSLADLDGAMGGP
jgi:putative iron-dependent peroxidase